MRGYFQLTSRGRWPPGLVRQGGGAEKVGMGRARRLATPAPGKVVLWEAAPEHQVSEL